MKPDDRIAIRGAFSNRKKDLPFDIGGHRASYMWIKSIGTITANPGDGTTVSVDWQPLHLPREWFFYTYPSKYPIVQAKRDYDLARWLILFAFAGVEQDYQFFLTRPYWAKKYGLGEGGTGAPR